MIQYGNLVTRYYSIVTKNSNYISIQRNFPIERQNDTYSTFQRKGHTQRVILQEDVENVGTKGQEQQVSPGYGRNYLIPKRKALYAIPKNIKKVEDMYGKPIERLQNTYKDGSNIKEYQFKTLAYSQTEIDLQFLRQSINSENYTDMKEYITKDHVLKRLKSFAPYHISDNDIYFPYNANVITKFGVYPIAVYLRSSDRSDWVHLLLVSRRIDQVFPRDVRQPTSKKATQGQGQQGQKVSDPVYKDHR